jgi:lipid II:glycine glycyltransferase (peptidoglycan interpeptide bridge formation enzyme)
MVSSHWNSILSGLPNPHFLQTFEWGQVKAKYGWEAIYAVWTADQFIVTRDQLPITNNYIAAALILKRQVIRSGFAARLSVLYSPKGPLLDWTNESLCQRVLDDLQAFAKRQGAIFLKIDPDVVLGTGVPRSEEDAPENSGQIVMSELKRRGWEYSSEQIQFRNTVIVDLNPTEEEMLAKMKQKTRYNIRLAERKGVALRVGTPGDLPMLYKMYAETSVRDGFVIRDEGYYKTVWELFMRSNVEMIQRANMPTCEPLIAAVNGEPVAAIFVFYFAGRAYYVYGMSRDVHRDKMPNYLLQWEAMKRARAKGCTIYDLWGAPEVFDESDSMWGVYRFKEGLGGKVVRTLGAWDYVPSPLWYKLYSDVMPRLLDVMRSRGRVKTRQALD